MDAVTSFMAARGATVNRYMVSGASKVEISLVTNCQIFLLLNIGPSVYHQSNYHVTAAYLHINSVAGPHGPQRP